MISWGVGFYSRVGFKWRRYGICIWLANWPSCERFDKILQDFARFWLILSESSLYQTNDNYFWRKSWNRRQRHDDNNNKYWIERRWGIPRRLKIPLSLYKWVSMTAVDISMLANKMTNKDIRITTTLPKGWFMVTEIWYL